MWLIFKCVRLAGVIIFYWSYLICNLWVGLLLCAGDRTRVAYAFSDDEAQFFKKPIGAPLSSLSGFYLIKFWG